MPENRFNVVNYRSSNPGPSDNRPLVKRSMNHRSLNHKKGMEGESAAEAFLKEKGYIILDRNYRFHHNEIDLVARDEGYLVFIEVKNRSSIANGYGYEAVNAHKQQLIRKVAESYLLRHRLDSYKTPCRFDVVSIDEGRISLYKNAF